MVLNTPSTLGSIPQFVVKNPITDHMKQKSSMRISRHYLLTISLNVASLAVGDPQSFSPQNHTRNTLTRLRISCGECAYLIAVSTASLTHSNSPSIADMLLLKMLAMVQDFYILSVSTLPKDITKSKLKKVTRKN